MPKVSFCEYHQGDDSSQDKANHYRIEDYPHFLPPLIGLQAWKEKLFNERHHKSEYICLSS
jgi:hypothetical protein